MILSFTLILAVHNIKSLLKYSYIHVCILMYVCTYVLTHYSAKDVLQASYSATYQSVFFMQLSKENQEI